MSSFYQQNSKKILLNFSFEYLKFFMAYQIAVVKTFKEIAYA